MINIDEWHKKHRYLALTEIVTEAILKTLVEATIHALLCRKVLHMHESASVLKSSKMIKGGLSSITNIFEAFPGSLALLKNYDKIIEMLMCWNRRAFLKTEVLGVAQSVFYISSLVYLSNI